MKTCYFIYNKKYIVKGTIIQKVFRLVPHEISDRYYGYIRCEDDFIDKMYYRYYYIIEVNSTCKLISINGGIEYQKDIIKHPINIVKPIEEVYDNIQDLMVNNAKIDYQPINKSWVKEILKNNYCPLEGYALDSQLNIIHVRLLTYHIKYATVHVNISKPCLFNNDCDQEEYYSEDNYKVTASYIRDDKNYYYSENIFISIADVVKAKMKHFKIIDSLDFKEAIYDDYNNINFEEIKNTILKRLK